jgi:hypothetical protein
LELKFPFKSAYEPHKLQVAFAFLFELTAGTNAVQVAVNEKAEQSSWVVCRPAIFLAIDLKPKFGRIQAIHEQVNETNLIIGIDMRIKAMHLPLISGFSLDKFHK